jgi:hypothetical protein
VAGPNSAASAATDDFVIFSRGYAVGVPAWTKAVMTKSWLTVVAKPLSPYVFVSQVLIPGAVATLIPRNYFKRSLYF